MVSGYWSRNGSCHGVESHDIGRMARDVLWSQSIKKLAFEGMKVDAFDNMNK